MDQTIYLIGLNHRSAGVEVREAFALTNCDACSIGLVVDSSPVTEAILLSTCNRVEILAVAEKNTPPELILQKWAEACGGEMASLSPHTYVYQNQQAVEHLFTVASSLDSMVMGEPQILGQLKTAYRNAVEHKTTKSILNRLLHKAFTVAKRVRTETAIASSAVSISYAAVELAKKIFGDMHTNKAMLIGAGEMAELAAAHLVKAGIQEIIVANRTFARAKELAEQFQGRPIPLDEMIATLPEADIIISSTGAPDTVLSAKNVRPALKSRKNKPMFFIDIAVPRDIEPDVNNLDNVYLYDIDDLKEVVEENMAQRKSEASKAQEIIDEEVAAFKLWLKALDLKPTIVELLNHGEELGKRELEKTLKRLGPNLPKGTEEALQILVHSLVQKLYHDPIESLKQTTHDEGQSDEFISILRFIFNLDNDDSFGGGHCKYAPQNNAEEVPHCRDSK